MVSKVRTQSRFSFSVRMKRSAQPLPSGSRTKAGELSRPRKRASAWKSWLTYWLPWSWRSRRGSDGRPAGPAPGPQAVRVAAGVDAQALRGAVVDGDEHRGLALASH